MPALCELLSDGLIEAQDTTVYKDVLGARVPVGAPTVNRLCLTAGMMVLVAGMAAGASG